MKSKFLLITLLVTLFCGNSYLNAQVSLCGTPSGLNATTITSNSATVKWNAVAGAIVYNVRYRLSPAPANTWLSVTTTADSANLFNLLSNSLYEYQVQAGCGSNGVIVLSAWSTINYFTTLGGGTSCNVPTRLFTDSIGTTSARTNWSSTGANSYRVRYKVAGTTAWTTISTTNTHKKLTGLTPNTTYIWQVRSVCIAPSGVKTMSAFSPSVTFQTLGLNACPTPTGLTAVSSSLSNILLSWNSTGAAAYNIRYRNSNTSAWVVTTSTTNSKLLTGLASGASYEWQVQSVCAINPGTVTLSPWSASAYFTFPSPIVINPNPVSNIVNLNYTAAAAEKVLVTIRDFYGASYISTNFNATDGSNNLTIDVSHLKNGLYYMELVGSESIQAAKFYIQH